MKSTDQGLVGRHFRNRENTVSWTRRQTCSVPTTGELRPEAFRPAWAIYWDNVQKTKPNKQKSTGKTMTGFVKQRKYLRSEE